MTLLFEKAYANTLGHEGGYSDDPKDPGNWTGGIIGSGELKGTKYGVSAMRYPELDIKNLTLEEAKEIYYRDWWLPLRCDELPGLIAIELFDNAFNQGPMVAIMCLQWACRFFGKNIEPDGKIGPATIAAANSLDERALCAAQNWFQITTYVVGSKNVRAVVEYMRPFFLSRQEHVRRFIRGWLRRVDI